MLLGVVLAGMLTAASQDLPRFTMTPRPGEALKAELFRLTPTDAAAEARALLGGTEADAEAFGLHAAGSLMMVYRQETGPADGLVLYAGPDSGYTPDAACRLTRNPDAEYDNSDRATRWCLSFILKTAPTLIIPPAPL